MTNREVLDKIFPDIPEYSGIDTWGDFWDEEYIPQNKEQLKAWMYMPELPEQKGR